MLAKIWKLVKKFLEGVKNAGLGFLGVVGAGLTINAIVHWGVGLFVPVPALPTYFLVLWGIGLLALGVTMIWGKQRDVVEMISTGVGASLLTQAIVFFSVFFVVGIWGIGPVLAQITLVLIGVVSGLVFGIPGYLCLNYSAFCRDKDMEEFL